MRYPIFIEPGKGDRAFGVAVPDLPGRFSAGDTLDEALDNAREAVSFWLEATLDGGGGLPKPTRIGDHIERYRKWIPSMEIDPVAVLGDRTARKRHQQRGAA